MQASMMLSPALGGMMEGKEVMEQGSERGAGICGMDDRQGGYAHG